MKIVSFMAIVLMAGALHLTFGLQLWICALIVIVAFLFNRFVISIEDQSMNQSEKHSSEQSFAWYRVVVWAVGLVVLGWLIYAVVTQP